MRPGLVNYLLFYLFMNTPFACARKDEMVLHTMTHVIKYNPKTERG